MSGEIMTAIAEWIHHTGGMSKRGGYRGRRDAAQILMGSKKYQPVKMKRFGDRYLHPTKGWRPIPWQERRANG